ncbi:hypothetical protein JTE90_016885 [Oedothorax gibbosus]|uniref:Uncharacterized protein n=1 Tax=Oedothorax gibbosus TaxID=931172 RepID=A0AAV6UC59_9ARAC|nr:hypothetical protein JTE90_016885 [Oedothorax gibbosus]
MPPIPKFIAINRLIEHYNLPIPIALEHPILLKMTNDRSPFPDTLPIVKPCSDLNKNSGRDTDRRKKRKVVENVEDSNVLIPIALQHPLKMTNDRSPFPDTLPIVKPCSDLNKNNTNE